jgi:hypothetical protein
MTPCFFSRIATIMPRLPKGSDALEEPGAECLRGPVSVNQHFRVQ